MDEPAKLVAVGLSGVVVTLMMLSVLLIGVSSAQEALISQAFGAGDDHLCGVYLNRGRLILVAFFIPLALIPSVYAEELLLVIGQDPK